MTLPKFELNILAISDIHLGHRKTPTEKIIENLKNVIKEDLLKELDLIFIAGDLFDHALGYNDENIFLIQQWLLSLLHQCSIYNVAIRVLEGTPLHDRKQSKHLVVLKENINIDVDLKYIDKVYIEKNEKFGLNILYVPDEWNADPDITWKDVKHCLKENDLEKVDFSIMHGMFEYQVPNMIQIRTHIKKRYENITKHNIIIGHVHQSSHNGKVIAPGSFDRLLHGDEGTKGCWNLKINRKTNIKNITFIENPNATKYITVDCSGLNFDSAIELISTLDVPKDSHIRIKAKKGENLLAILEWCKLNFFQYYWSLLLINEERKSLKYNPVVKIAPMIINERSIESQIIERLDESTDEYTLSRVKSILKEII